MRYSVELEDKPGYLHARVTSVNSREAVIEDGEQHDRSRVKFAEDVAVSRNANMRLFGSVADAERWPEAELAGAGSAH